MKREIAELTALHTGQPVETVTADADRDRWFTPSRPGVRPGRPRRGTNRTDRTYPAYRFPREAAGTRPGDHARPVRQAAAKHGVMDR